MSAIYKKIADRLAKRIRGGEFLPGEKIPSLRTVSRLEGVSLMTTFAAFTHLESQGLVTASPRSGFVVCRQEIPLVDGSPPEELWYEKPGTNKDQTIAAILAALSDSRFVPLGAGSPSPELFPNVEINKSLRRVMRDEPFHSTQYSVAAGDLQLRREICRRLNRRGCKLTPSGIVLAAGGMEALEICLSRLLSPGDHVLVEAPIYFGIHQVLKNRNVQVFEVLSDAVNGIDLDAAFQLLKSTRIKVAVLMPNFNNPTGAAMPDQNKKELIRLLTHHGVVIVEDDIYADLSYSGRSPLPLLSMQESKDSEHYLIGSFSKTLAPGMRIGYIASSGDCLDLLSRKFSISISNNRLAELVAADLLRSGAYDHHIKKLTSTLEANLRKFQSTVLRQFPDGTKVSDPAGGFLLWVQLPKNVSATKVYERCLRKKISVAPGFIFSAHHKLHNFIRINCGTLWNQSTSDAMNVVSAIVNSESRQSS